MATTSETNGHTHSYTEEAARTGRGGNGHTHKIPEDGQFTGSTNGHTHLLPTRLTETRTKHTEFHATRLRKSLIEGVKAEAGRNLAERFALRQNSN